MGMPETGIYNFSCSHEDNYRGTLEIFATSDELRTINTGEIEIWSSESYFTFWAKYNMSYDSQLSIKGGNSEWSSNLPLTEANGFSIIYANNQTLIGDNLRGNTNGQWILFMVFLDSDKLGL